MAKQTTRISIISHFMYVSCVGYVISAVCYLFAGIDAGNYILLGMSMPLLILGYLKAILLKRSYPMVYYFHLSGHWKKEVLIYRTLRSHNEQKPDFSRLKILSWIVLLEGLSVFGITAAGTIFYLAVTDRVEGLLAQFVIVVCPVLLAIGFVTVYYCYWVFKAMNFITKYKDESAELM